MHLLTSTATSLVDWQFLVTLVIIAFALVRIAARCLNLVRGRPNACGGCHACPNKDEPQLVTLEARGDW